MRNLLVMAVITVVFLEIATRMIWGGESNITMLGREVSLLPLPLVTQKQVDILVDYYDNEESFVQFDQQLGWTIRPNVSTTEDGTTYTSNGNGIRSLQDYNLAKPDDILRIAAFGPSFIGGWEVNDDKIWSAVLENARPGLEVMNWGVGAYGTDQSYLRYKTQGALYHPDIVLIGYEEDNLWRNVNRFRPYYFRETGAPLTKPVYIMEQDKLVLLENPFEDFDAFYHTLVNQPNEFIDMTCPHDWFCKEHSFRAYPFDILQSFRILRTLAFEMVKNQSDPEVEPTPDEITIHILEMFVQEVKSQQAKPIIVFFPQHAGTLSDFEMGINPDYYEILSAMQGKVDVDVIDLTPIFVKAKQEETLQFQDFFVYEGGHYSELGNAIFAQAVVQFLDEFASR